MSQNDEKCPLLGRKLLVYQRIDGEFAPKSPFSAVIMGDVKSRWVLKYQLSDGSFEQKRILKGVCSSKPIDKSVDQSIFEPKQEKPKVQIRRRLPT